MSDNLYKYFFIVGINHKDVITQTYNEIINEKPTLLSSYSYDGLSQEFFELKSLFFQNNDFIQTIFPPSFTEDDLINYSHDQKSYSEQENTLIEYIQEQTSAPSPIYHATQIQLSNNRIIHCGIMIIYEQLHNGKNIINKLYIGKALILISKYPTYYLSKILLECLLNKMKFTLFPIEFIIEEWFTNLNIDSSIINNTIHSEYNDSQYTCNTHYLLSKCDINYIKLISLFTFDDIIKIAQHFFMNNAILISSNSLDYIYPLFALFLSIFHPFNTVDSYYAYRLLNYENFNTSITKPCMLGIYCDCIPGEFIKKWLNKIQTDIHHIHVELSETTKQIKLHIKTHQATKKRSSLLNMFYSQITQPKKLTLNLLEYVDNFDVLFDLKLVDSIKKNLQLLKENDTENNVYMLYTNKEQINKIIVTKCSIMGMFVSFFSNIINKIDCDGNGQDELFDINIQIQQGVKLNSSVFNILTKSNFDNDNENDLYDIDLIGEIVKEYKKGNKEILRFVSWELAKENISKEVIDINYPPKSVFYYLNKIQRLKIRSRSNHNTQNLKILTNCCKLPYLKYNQKDFILSWENKKIPLSIQETNEFLPIIISMHSFNKLLTSQVVTLSNKEAVQCLICISIGIILLNIKKVPEINVNYIKKYFKIYFNIFTKTKGFDNKIDFLIVLLYHIISQYREIFINERNSFIKQLMEYNIIPSAAFRLECSYKKKRKKDKETMFRVCIESIKQLYEICKEGKHKVCILNKYSKNTPFIKCNRENCNQICQYEVVYGYAMDRQSLLVNEKHVVVKLIHPQVVFVNMMKLILRNKTFDIKVLEQENQRNVNNVIELLINVAMYQEISFEENNDNEFKELEKILFRDKILINDSN